MTNPPKTVIAALAVVLAGCQSTPYATPDSTPIPAPNLTPIAETKDVTKAKESVASTQSTAPQGQPVDASVEASDKATKDSTAVVSAEVTGESMPQRKQPFLPQLSIFASDEFRAAFAASFAPAANTEPPITDDDRSGLQKVVDLLRPPEPKVPENETPKEKAQREAKAAKDEATRRERALVVVERARLGADCHANYHLIAGNLFFWQASNATDEKEQRLLFEKAVAAYQAAVEKFPRFLRAWQGLGQAQYRKKNHAGVVDALTEVVKLGGASGTTYGLLGVGYANTKRYLEAETAFRRAAMLQPRVQDWKLGLAESLFAQQRFADAAVLCGSLIERQPDKETLWKIQARAYVGMQQHKLAAENFEVIDALGKSTADTLHTLGDIYVNEGLYDLAASAYVRGMAKDASTAQTKGIRAARILVARTGYDATKTIADYLEANHKDELTKENKIELLRLRARIALSEGGTAEQAAILERILEVEPMDGDALVLLGRYYGRNEKEAEAIFCFERAAGIEKFEARAKLGHAELLVRQRKYRAAVPLLQRALELNDSEPVAEFLDKVKRAAKAQK